MIAAKIQHLENRELWSEARISPCCCFLLASSEICDKRGGIEMRIKVLSCHSRNEALAWLMSQ